MPKMQGTKNPLSSVQNNKIVNLNSLKNKNKEGMS